MIVVDVETTGTNPIKHSLTSIGAVDFKNPTKQFYQECQIWEGAHIMTEALVVNGYSEKELYDSHKQTEGELVQAFLAWLGDREEHTLAGQNPFFDLSFIEAGATRNHFNFSLPQRTIDMHSICYAHMTKRGLTPPVKNKRTDLNSDTIMKYVGIPTEPRPHIALNGAIWEAEAFSRLLHDKFLFPKFEKLKIPWV